MSEVGPNATCIFIPDISGFTSFVQSTEIEHSGHLISELLEILIDHNALDLQLAEIEGDALFYYKHASIPTTQDLVAQARKMYLAFHRHLRYYEAHRICRCGACQTAHKLQLKFIVHAGPIDFVKIKDVVKPHGTSVIAAHRLLKNSIDSDEYLLLSEDVTGPAFKDEELTWKRGEEQLDVGRMGYYFAELGKWQSELMDPQVATEQSNDSRLLLQLENQIEAEPMRIFELLTNFRHRMKWSKGAKDIEYEPDRVNRIGAKHVCVFDQTKIEFETIHKDEGSGALVYGERTDALPGFKYVDTYFVVHADQQTSRLEVRLYGKSGFWGRVLTPVIRRKLGSGIRSQIAELKKLAETTPEIA